jgi:hypothetical protein
MGSYNRNYISVVDEIIRNVKKEVDYFADTEEEAESLCEYLERRIQSLCKDVKDGFKEL